MPHLLLCLTDHLADSLRARPAFVSEASWARPSQYIHARMGPGFL
jgi:hypothetical protein